MAVIFNFNVYTLMILPLAIMFKGHKLPIGRSLALLVVCATLQLLASALTNSLPVSLAELGRGMVESGVLVVFFAFALNDGKARSTLHLTAGDGDAAAMLSTVWCIAYTALFDWFPWYHTMSSPGFETGVFLSAVSAFLRLVAVLAAARCLHGNNRGAQGYVLAALAVPAAAQWVTGIPLLQTGLAAAILLAAPLFSIKEKKLD